MKLEPIITEKSLKLASGGRYSFRVARTVNKRQIKRLIEEAFDVHVVSVKTIKEKGEVKKTFRGRKKIIMPSKKAIVKLKDKEKIDLFDQGKKGKVV